MYLSVTELCCLSSSALVPALATFFSPFSFDLLFLPLQAAAFEVSLGQRVVVFFFFFAFCDAASSATSLLRRSSLLSPPLSSFLPPPLSCGAPASLPPLESQAPLLVTVPCPPGSPNFLSLEFNPRPRTPSVRRMGCLNSPSWFAWGCNVVRINFVRWISSSLSYPVPPFLASMRYFLGLRCIRSFF